MPAPVMTFGTEGNVLATVASLAANASTTPANLDLSAKFEGHVQVDVTFGTISVAPASSGLRVDIGRRVGTTPQADAAPFAGITIAAVAGAQRQSIALPTGRYEVKMTNLDASYPVTNVNATVDTVDSIT